MKKSVTICENMDQSFTIDSESDAEHSEEETDDEEHDSSCDVNQSNFIVFWSCLAPLFRFCSICFKPASIEKILVKGTLLIVHILCVANHESKWFSQPLIRHEPVGNLPHF